MSPSGLMQSDVSSDPRNVALQARLIDVRRLMVDSLRETSLESRVDEFDSVVGGGKMLRARLALRIGPAAGAPLKTCLFSAAAVEMIHAASLLHDDVIDDSGLRRGVPSFWVREGVSAAILLGDLLVCRSMSLINEVEDGLLVPILVKLAGEMCDAEVQQEILLHDQPPEWETCVDIARRKTGALFAFAGHVCGGQDTHLRIALQECGYAVGTAYQLADDLLDAFGDQVAASKTLGNDAAGAKVTAASVWQAHGVDPVARINDLCKTSRDMLNPWPDVAQAWQEFLAYDIEPVIDAFVERFSLASAH